MQIIGNQAFFTDKERARIDRLLEESEEMQRQNGNRLYTQEEVWGAIMEVHNRNLQNYLSYNCTNGLN